MRYLLYIFQCKIDKPILVAIIKPTGCVTDLLHHGRDVHLTWVKFTETLSNKGVRFLSSKSEEDLGSF